MNAKNSKDRELTNSTYSEVVKCPLEAEISWVIIRPGSHQRPITQHFAHNSYPFR